MRRLHILFVDADQHACEKAQQSLGQEFAVFCVCSVPEAKAYLDKTTPDILVSEVELGKESGLDLCHYIRATPSLQTLPFMLLTTHATLYDKVQGFRTGADDYVVKPCDARHLVARIRLLSRIKRIEQRLKAL